MTDDELLSLLGLVEEAAPADDDEEFYSSVLAGLRGLIPCDDITFQVKDARRHLLRGVSVTDEGVSRLENDDPAGLEEFWVRSAEAWCMALFRASGPDFTEHDLLLRLVRPHPDELHRRRQQNLLGEPNLTARQWEILRRVASGASNAQVARTLGLSQGRSASTSRTSSCAWTSSVAPRRCTASAGSSGPADPLRRP